MSERETALKGIDKDDALGMLRGAAEDVGNLWNRVYSRLNGGDIPWNAATDIQGEFGEDFTLIQRDIKRAEKVLAGADPVPVCQWREDGGNGYYNTGCNVATDYFEDAPTSTQNGWKFCPYCGKPLALVPAEEDRCVQ